jgi:hypothetical protein
VLTATRRRTQRRSALFMSFAGRVQFECRVMRREWTSLLLGLGLARVNVTNITILEMQALGVMEDLWPSFESLPS